MRYVAVVRDVTELTHARRAVAERTARLNAVFELSPDGFVLFDRDGRLAFCNRAFVQMTGWNSAASLVGMPQAEFDRRMALLGEPGAESSGWVGEGEVTTLQLRLPQPRVLARTLRRRDDAQGGTVLYFRDITHETEVDRMKSEFLTTAAHELRTPMVSVFGFTELLLNRPVPEARRRDMLETIHRQSTLLINMVNELLDLARIEARGGKDLRPCDCEVGELVRQAAAGFMVEGADRALRLELPHEQSRVHVDPDKLVRALTNVLSNACKYSPDGGDVDLATTAGRVGGRPAVGLRVTDRGIGMTPTQQARMFERFYRADPSGNIPGTGLGMCLVKEIVELHQGRVEVQSEPGRGTTVTLWLPLADAGHEARVDSAEPAAA